MFYFLQKSSDVGAVPQIQKSIFREYNSEKFWRANRNFDPILNNTVPAPTLFLEYRAKITDSLSAANFLYPFEIVNEKLLQFIKSVRADDLRIMPTTAIKKEASYPYWFVAIDTIYAEYVDYPKSRFVLNEMLNDIEHLHIPDADAFYKKKESLPPRITILARKLVLNESVIQHDIFRLPNFTQPRYVVSEEFRQGIEKAKITGLSFEPLVDDATGHDVKF